MNKTIATIDNVRFEIIEDLMLGREKGFVDEDGKPAPVIRFTLRHDSDCRFNDGDYVIKDECADQILTIHQTNEILKQAKLDPKDYKKLEGMKCEVNCTRNINVRMSVFNRLLI